MNNNLTTHKWSGSAASSINSNSDMVFETEGYLCNENTFLNNEKQYEIHSEFIYNGLDIGLILWYNYKVGYIKYVINSEELKLERIKDSGAIRVLGREGYSENIPELEIGDTVALKVIVNGSNIRCYYNEVEVINSEQRFASEGIFGIYGSEGEICQNFSIKSDGIDGWSAHVESPASVTNLEYGKVDIHTIEGLFTYIYQDIDVEQDEDYTISFDSSNEVRIELHGNSGIIGTKDFSTSFRSSYTFNSEENSTIRVKIGSNKEGSSTISKPLIEKKSFSTSYTKESRGRSSLTFPAKKMNINNGGFGLLVSPIHNYLTEEDPMPIFYYNDNFQVNYKYGILVAKYGETEVTINKILEDQKSYYIYMIWENKKDIAISIVDMDGNGGTYNKLPVGNEIIQENDYFYIGSKPNISGNLIVDNLVVYKNYTTSGLLEEHVLNPDYENENIIIRADFNQETLIYNKNKIIVPAPKPNSPIIIETSQGDIYDRVCFVSNSKYVIYNYEEMVYNGENTYEIPHDNILNVEGYVAGKILKNIDVKDIVVDDRKTGKSIVILSEDDLGDLEIGTIIRLKYSIRNTFCINYDDEHKQYEILLSNVDDENLLIQYEEEAGVDRTMIKTVELNPFESVNSSGFIYIENQARILETFDIKITPDSIIANGFDIATISIDCLSANGSTVSNVDLEVVSKHSYGHITRYMCEEEKLWKKIAKEHGEDVALERLGNLITDEHRSGRFIYKYLSRPGKSIVKDNTEIEKEYEIIDQIIIRDRISKVGVQIPIRLVREE